MTRPLKATARKHLRKAAGANTHFLLDPSVYTRNEVPNPAIIAAIDYLRVGYVRERYWPNDPGQKAAFAMLAKRGVGLFLFIGDMTYPTERVRAEVAALARSPVADSVVAVCGPNEANKQQGSSWPAKAVDIQRAIHTEVFNHPAFSRHVAVVSPALMHNVPDIDRDYRALRAAGIIRWCDAGDFHFYPGNAGPHLNHSEAIRARQAYGRLPLWHSETGWTGADTPPAVAGKFSVEAVLRNRLSGIVGTVLYEFADESQFMPGREGLFGLRTPFQPKPAYSMLHTLLALPDGNLRFDGWLTDYSSGVRSDVGAVVTSEGHDAWTVYLMRRNQNRATIVFNPNRGPQQRRTVSLTDSLMVVHLHG